MSLRRVPFLAVLMLSLGSAIAFAHPNSPLPQASLQGQAALQPFGHPTAGGIAQNTEEQRRPGRDKSQLFQELDLTPEQNQQIQTIQNQYREQISQRGQALRQARRELLDLMASTTSEGQIREKYRQVAALQQQVSDIRFDSMLAMREVLTPEQRRQFAEQKQNRWRRDKDRETNRGEQG